MIIHGKFRVTRTKNKKNNHMKYALNVLVILGTLMFLDISCNNDTPDAGKTTRHISFSFTHLVNG